MASLEQPSSARVQCFGEEVDAKQVKHLNPATGIWEAQGRVWDGREAMRIENVPMAVQLRKKMDALRVLLRGKSLVELGFRIWGFIGTISLHVAAPEDSIQVVLYPERCPQKPSLHLGEWQYRFAVKVMGQSDVEVSPCQEKTYPSEYASVAPARTLRDPTVAGQISEIGLALIDALLEQEIRRCSEQNFATMNPLVRQQVATILGKSGL